MISRLRCGAFVLCLLTPFTADAAAILHVVDGRLHGASGVEVDGSLYDVAFLDGTCISVFNGCDSVGDFTFQSFEGAHSASQALLDQVFLDSALGQFDSDARLTVGCGAFLGCVSLTPYGFTGLPSVVFVGAVNDSAGFVDIEDRISSGQVRPNYATLGDNICDVPSNCDMDVWAVWTPHSAQVPEPTTLGLLVGSTLVTLGLRRRRRRL